MAQTLASAKESIDRFLVEAKICAECECGFSAMLTSFSVILAVSEAVTRSRGNIPLMKWFTANIDNERVWLTLPHGVEFSVDSVGVKLADLRDSLAHQFSMPNDILLVNDKESAKTKSVENPDKIIISTKEFVSAIRDTVDKIVTSNPTAILDISPPPRMEDRGAAIRIETGIESQPASGSSGGRVPVSAASFVVTTSEED